MPGLTHGRDPVQEWSLGHRGGAQPSGHRSWANTKSVWASDARKWVASARRSSTRLTSPTRMSCVANEVAEQVRTEAASGEGTDQDTRFEDDFHETILKTSSSVKIPGASARGRRARRASLKRRRATWRRTASRTRSLLASAEAAAQPVEIPLQLRVESDGNGGSFHVRQRAH